MGLPQYLVFRLNLVILLVSVDITANCSAPLSVLSPTYIAIADTAIPAMYLEPATASAFPAACCRVLFNLKVAFSSCDIELLKY